MTKQATVTVRVDVDDVARLDRVAAQHVFGTRSNIARVALRLGLAEIERRGLAALREGSGPSAQPEAPAPQSAPAPAPKPAPVPVAEASAAKTAQSAAPAAKSSPAAAKPRKVPASTKPANVPPAPVEVEPGSDGVYREPAPKSAKTKAAAKPRKPAKPAAPAESATSEAAAKAGTFKVVYQVTGKDGSSKTIRTAKHDTQAARDEWLAKAERHPRWDGIVSMDPPKP